MPKRGAKKSPRVFLDSSVLVAAALSASGGSFRLLQEGNQGRLRLMTNRYVVDEVGQALSKKYPHALGRFRALVPWACLDIAFDPPERLVAQYLAYIHPEDAPICAGAIKARANFLLTLDRKHFLGDKLAHFVSPLLILTPADFFQRHWLSLT